MKIIDKRGSATVRFESVEEGEVFYTSTLIGPYIRIRHVCDEGEVSYNVVDLEYGTLDYMERDEAVILCNAELHIS